MQAATDAHSSTLTVDPERSEDDAVMADFQNAGYRLLSFKYVPPPAPPPPTTTPPTSTQPVEDVEPLLIPPQATSSKSQGDGELLSLSSLLTPLQEIEAVENKKKADEAFNEPKLDMTCAQLTALPADFFRFPDLPTEIRLKIWALTFLPRVVEIRPTRPNYSQARNDNAREPQWLSGNTNAAVLSVTVEARQAALAHFRIPFPLALLAPTTSTTPTTTTTLSSSMHAPLCTNNPFSAPTPTPRLFPDPIPTRKAHLLHRTLHLAPTHDTVCLLGQDADLARLTQCLAALRAADPQRTGIERLGLSVRGWGYGGSAVALRRGGVLGGLRELVLFLYGEHAPPVGWAVVVGGGGARRGAGNRCVLARCDEEAEGSASWYAYKVWSGGMGRQFRAGDGGWMRIGRERREIGVMDLLFEEGW